MLCECYRTFYRKSNGKRKRVTDFCHRPITHKYKIIGSIASVIIYACERCFDNIVTTHRNWGWEKLD